MLEALTEKYRKKKHIWHAIEIEEAPMDSAKERSHCAVY